MSECALIASKQQVSNSNNDISFPTEKYIAVFCVESKREGRKGEGRREEEWGKHIVHFYLNNKIEKNNRNLTGKVCMSA